MAKYMYLPFCPYCGTQAMEFIEVDREITKPERMRTVKTCIWCGKEFMEYAVIEPEGFVEDHGIYMQLMENLQDPEFKSEWKKWARDHLFKSKSIDGE